MIACMVGKSLLNILSLLGELPLLLLTLSSKSSDLERSDVYTTINRTKNSEHPLHHYTKSFLLYLSLIFFSLYFSSHQFTILTIKKSFNYTRTCFAGKTSSPRLVVENLISL